jgi:hypothetical protein
MVRPEASGFEARFHSKVILTFWEAIPTGKWNPGGRRKRNRLASGKTCTALLGDQKGSEPNVLDVHELYFPLESYEQQRLSERQEKWRQVEPTAC